MSGKIIGLGFWISLFVSSWTSAQPWVDHTKNYVGTYLLSDGSIGAASSDGFFQISSNAGRNWSTTTRLPFYSLFYNIEKLYTYNKDTLYAYNDYKLTKSTNGGRNWTMLTAPGFTFTEGYVFFDDTAAVALGTTGSSVGRISRTSNGANSWNLMTVTSKYFRGIHKINATTAIAHGNVLLRTTNRGKTWFTTTATSIAVNDIRVMASFSNYVFAFEFGASTAFFVSTNSGESYAVKRTFPNENVTAAAFESTSTGWVATYQGNLYTTTNAGNSWTRALTVCNTIQSIELQGNTILVSATQGNLYQSNTKGNTWQHLTGSQACLNFRYTNTFSFNDSIAVVVGGNGTSGFILRTTNGGKTFPKVSFTGNHLSVVKFLNPREGFSVGNQGGIYKTLDSGKTWTSVTSTITSNLTFLSYPAKDTLYVGSPKAIWYSYNNGNTWTMASNPISSYDIITGMEFVNGKTGFLTTTMAFVNRTTDAGISWPTARYITSNVEYYGIAFHIPSRQGVVNGSGYSSKSTDLGTTWDGTFESSYSGFNYVKSFFFLTDKITYGIRNYTLSVSSTSGSTWTSELDLYPDAPLSIHGASSGKVLAVSSLRVLSKIDRSVNVLTAENDSKIEQTPKESTKIYPNPAKDYIRIDNTSNEQEYDIYDSMGKQVKFKVSSPVHIGDLPVGIYILKSKDQESIRFIKE